MYAGTCVRKEGLRKLSFRSLWPVQYSWPFMLCLSLIPIALEFLSQQRCVTWLAPAIRSLTQEYLLVTADTTFVRRRRIARLLCHEVSHMWYGDIVTPESFDELWLKEVRYGTQHSTGGLSTTDVKGFSGRALVFIVGDLSASAFLTF